MRYDGIEFYSESRNRIRPRLVLLGKAVSAALMELNSRTFMGILDLVMLYVCLCCDVHWNEAQIFLPWLFIYLLGNTPLHYAACGGHEEVVRALIDSTANVEEHNENGHTPLMEAASAGHVGVAKILLDAGAGINTHSNEFKESALTLACYKGKEDDTRPNKEQAVMDC